jgi:uracil DNA glycosylase
MSSSINSKDIINKQKEKYADSMWSNFLLQEFDKPTFEKLLDKLIEGLSKGKTFTPPIKSWFTDFTAVNPDNLKVVIVSKDLRYVEKMSQFNSPEELNKQGVMFFALGRTSIAGKTDLEDWRMFNIYFLDHLIATRKDVVYIFVGFEASDYSDLISDEEYGCKVFLPDYDHAIWNSPTLYQLFNKNINTLLNNREIDTINW